MLGTQPGDYFGILNYLLKVYLETQFRSASAFSPVNNAPGPKHTPELSNSNCAEVKRTLRQSDWPELRQNGSFEAKQVRCT